MTVCTYSSLCFCNPQISAVVSLHGEVQASVPSSVVQRFQSIPSPQNIKVIATNPRILQLQSDGMLQISFELFVSWTWPRLGVSVRNFEIYISYSADDFLCVYDSFSQLPTTEVYSYMHLYKKNKCVP